MKSGITQATLPPSILGAKDGPKCTTPFLCVIIACDHQPLPRKGESLNPLRIKAFRWLPKGSRVHEHSLFWRSCKRLRVSGLQDSESIYHDAALLRNPLPRPLLTRSPAPRRFGRFSNQRNGGSRSPESRLASSGCQCHRHQLYHIHWPSLTVRKLGA